MLRSIFIWLAAALVAIVAGTTAMGAISKRDAPEFAIALQPPNGFVKEAIATRRLKTEVAKKQGAFPDSISPELKLLAENAFRAEPVTPQAVAIMALAVKNPVRRELMKMALDLSRREALVTGWMIADSAAREDVSSLLNHYDTMLRTSATSGEIIIPVMVQALAKRDAIEPFRIKLSHSPPWSDRFWTKVAENSEALDNVVVLRQELYSKNEQGNNYRDAALIYALITNNKFGKAKKLFELLSKPTGNSNIIQNGEFKSVPKYPPMDWQLFSTGEYGAAIDKNRLNLSIIPNSSGLFARQLVKLPRQTVDLKIKGSWTGSQNDLLAFDLYCSEDIMDKPNKITMPFEGGVMSTAIDNTKTSCDYFWLEIRGRAGQAGNGFDAYFNSISIKPRG